MRAESHSVFWLVPFHFDPIAEGEDDSLPNISLETISGASWLPSNRVHAELSQEAIWTTDTPALKSDLLPHVERLLGGEGGTGKRLSNRLLSASSKCLGLLGNRRDNFAVALTANALQRLGLQQQKCSDGNPVKVVLPFRLDSVHLYRFTTGVGVLVMEIHYAKPERVDAQPLDCSTLNETAILLEGNHLLGHPKRGDAFYWRSSFAMGKSPKELKLIDINDSFIKQDDLSLVSLIQLLLSSVSSDKSAEFSRLYSYSVTSLTAATEEETADYALRLARRYTLDYAPNPNDCNIYRPFTDVIHVGEFEGAATVVNTDRSVDFLGDYINKVVHPTLLPMLIIAIHEQSFLLDLAESSSTKYLETKKESKRAKLLQLQRACFIDYRLNYRFEYAARLSAQNGVYRLWREGLRAEEIASGLDDDLKNMAELEQERSQYFRKRLETIKVAIISGISVFFVAEKTAVAFGALPDSGTAIAAVLALIITGVSWRFKQEISINQKLVEASARILPASYKDQA